MVDTELVKAVINQTLPNDEALLQLYDRRDHYAKCDLSQQPNAEIARLFEAAIPAAREAVATGVPVVRVLKKGMLDVGHLLHAHEKKANHDSDNNTASTDCCYTFSVC